MVNPSNSWVNSMSIAELRQLWEPAAQGKITHWNQINEDWPDKEVHLYGPGTDSGTYDYFTQAIVGKEGASRGDFQASEDDNVLVQGISSDKLALGFFGLAYYEENRQQLKVVGIDDGNSGNGDGPIKPNERTVNDGTYQPLSRPIFIYVSKDSVTRPEVQKFVEFYLNNGQLVKEVGYVSLPESIVTKVGSRFTKLVTGSIYGRGSQVGITLQDLLAKE